MLYLHPLNEIAEEVDEEGDAGDEEGGNLDIMPEELLNQTKPVAMTEEITRARPVQLCLLENPVQYELASS